MSSVADKLTLGGQRCSRGDFQQASRNIRHEPKRSHFPRAGHVEFGATHTEMEIENNIIHLSFKDKSVGQGEQQIQNWTLEAPAYIGDRVGG